MATVIDRAVEWAVQIANDPSHGYDQRKRWGPDYDCSSFVITAYDKAGVDIQAKGGTRTANMCPAMLRCGFVEITNIVKFKSGEGLQKGDIVWRQGHVEMMSSSTHLVGAHTSESGKYAKYEGDQTGHEIDVMPYKNKEWTRAFRYPGGSSETIPIIDKGDVISANRYLSLSEMLNNAIYIASRLMSDGWTLEAICGMLGNMQAESTINPGIWQSLNEGNMSGGYGLVQWTPASKYLEWAAARGYEAGDIDGQIERIKYEVAEGIQYYPTSTYPETFVEFTQSTKDVGYLACAFLHNYERPAEPNDEGRIANAEYWYKTLSGLNFEPGDGYREKRKMSIVLMYAAINRRL